jgi:anti-sigma factor RsiW
MSGEPLSCARVRVLLEAYVDGEGGRDDATTGAAVRGHLAGCADCRRQHAQATSLPFRLKALSSPSPRESLLTEVMRAVSPEHAVQRRVWTLLVPEGVLAAFIFWYLSGLDGLASITSGAFGDLLSLGSGSVPRVPQVDAVLLVAVIALMAITAYHLSILIRLAPAPSRRVVP